MTELIWANFRARPLRSLLSIAAVGLQVFLLIFMVGLVQGVAREWSQRMVGIGADLMVQPPGSPIYMGFGKASLPQREGERLRKVPGVDVVSPTMTVPNTKGISVIYAIDFRTYDMLGDGFSFMAGGPFNGDFDVIIDDLKAQTGELHVGDAVELLERLWRVSGIVKRGRGARYFIPLETAQRLLEVPGRVSMFLVSVEEKGLIEDVREKVVAAVPKRKVRGMEEYLSLLVPGNIPLLKPFTNSIIAIGLIITFLVILLSMYTIVLERTREIGILKALGASRWDVVGLMVKESILIGILGFAFGVAASYGFREMFLILRPSMTVDISQAWIIRGGILALIGCVLGSLYPSIRASALDPVDALGYR